MVDGEGGAVWAGLDVLDVLVVRTELKEQVAAGAWTVMRTKPLVSMARAHVMRALTVDTTRV